MVISEPVHTQAGSTEGFVIEDGMDNDHCPLLVLYVDQVSIMGNLHLHLLALLIENVIFVIL